MFNTNHNDHEYSNFTLEMVLDTINKNEISMMNQNKMVFLFINKLILNNDYDSIKILLSRSVFDSFHPSLMKSMLIMTSQLNHIHGIEFLRIFVEEDMYKRLK